MMRINSIRSLLGCHDFKEGTARHELSSASGGKGATVQVKYPLKSITSPCVAARGVNPDTLTTEAGPSAGLPHVAVFVAVLDFGGNPATDLARMRKEPPFG